jgi:probable HAF family extracellular repeat protein
MARAAGYHGGVPVRPVAVLLAWGIDNAGRIVGAAERGDGAQRAFLWQDGVMYDLDWSGAVDPADLELLLAAWGPCAAPCTPACVADIDGDCDVGILDFWLLLANWTEQAS